MSKGSAANAPLVSFGEHNRGPVIIIAAYSWICISSIVASIRFGLAWNQRLPFKVDDGSFLTGLVLAIASSVLFHLAVTGGLGRHMTDVDSTSLAQFYQMLYAAELTGVFAMASAKTSVVLLSDRVAPREARSYYLMLGMVAVWTIFSTFALAFQCSLPDPWTFTRENCPSRGNLYYPIIIFNIITDALLATWILPTLRKLLMPTNKRVTVMLLFGARLVVCCFSIVQLVSVAQHIRSPDVTYGSFGRVLWGIFVIHLSVLLATIPRTNRFMTALQSMNTTTIISDFELASPNGQQRAGPKPALSTATDTADTNDTLIRPQSPSHSRSPSPTARSHAPSMSRSNKSHEPLVGPPLKLTPSVEQNFHTYISSQTPQDSQEERKNNTKTKKIDDWKKYLGRQKKGEETNLSSLFSWNSRTSQRIVQTREVIQEVEVVPPRESRWVLSIPRKLSRGT
ncbi:hypothetical protein BDV95DRAFT_610967 [Massariosphaeria phaeospora]|uniref:Rhodopsin domain-containing protein n=1 Tax=Massariosphaeria phaeospora TaxID=100035 RepID=A0A7C8M6F0_9PLEO|nr:hypothetical protein BDV95DRAFT_610967 [Massariosphaeria phaeospora]